jgi:hypothetical protein
MKEKEFYKLIGDTHDLLVKEIEKNIFLDENQKREIANKWNTIKENMLTEVKIKVIE